MLGLLGGAGPRPARAQARPDGADRVWAEVGLGGARQDQRCRGCARAGAIGGPAVSLSAGVTLPRGWGVAAQGRAFQEFSFEYSQSSRYGVALVQYSPPGLAALTLNAGAGWGSHRGDSAPYANDGSGGVLAAGVALRAPHRSVVGLSLTADLMQSVGGRAGYRPRLLAMGAAVNLASVTRDPRRH